MRKEIIGDCTLYHGDCLEVLPGIEAGVCLTSPPYNLGGFHQMHNGNSAKWNYDNFRDDLPEDAYQDNQKVVLDLIAKTGCEVLFYSHKNRIVKGRMISPIEWVSHTVWTIHQQVVLNKGSGANVDKRRFFPVHEVLLVCFINPNIKLKNSAMLTDVWCVEQTNRKTARHPAVMPPSVAAKALSAICDMDVVLDPYMGSGTTALAAINNDKAFVGVEQSLEYFDLSCRRIENAYKTKPRLFSGQQKKKPEQGKLFC